MLKRNATKIAVGYDLGDVTSQISYWKTGEEEPRTISTVAGMEQFNFPTAICKRREVNQWYFGKEALKQDGDIVVNLLTLAKEKELVSVDGIEFEPLDLLILFVKRSLSLLFLETQIDKIQKITSLTFTVDELTEGMLGILRKVAASLPLEEEQIMFQSRQESFFSYMIHQPSDVFSNQVLLFHLSTGYLQTYRMEMNRRTVPIVSFIHAKEFPHVDFTRVPKTEVALENFQKTVDEEMLEIARNLCKEGIISSVYLIGDAFADGFCKETLRLLCKGRRVFLGNNLFSKGACYSAREAVTVDEKEKSYVFLGSDKLKANVGMRLIRNGEEIYYALLDAGKNWYDASASFEILLEREPVLTFLITPLNGRETKRAEITLHGLPQRPLKASRIHIKINLAGENRIRILLKDMGFGEIFSSTGMEWIEEFDLL